MTEFNSFYRTLQMLAILATGLVACIVIIGVAAAIGSTPY